MKLSCEWIDCGKKYRYPKVGHLWTEINTHTHKSKEQQNAQIHTHTHRVNMKSQARCCFAEEMKKCLFTEVKWEVKMSIKTASGVSPKGQPNPSYRTQHRHQLKVSQNTTATQIAAGRLKAITEWSVSNICSLLHPTLGRSATVSVTSYTPRPGQ